MAIRQPWKTDPKCAKCRRTGPTMLWGRWTPFQDVFLASPRAEDECLRLACVRCHHEWLMELAPAELPAKAATAVPA